MNRSSAWLPLLLLGLLGSSAWAQNAPDHPLTLRGPSMGPVTFPHPAHLKVAGRCEICHHSSKPEKPLKAPQEACSDCHTNPATAPMSTGLRGAFHNSSASEGLCITCHKTENARGKAAPVRCAHCHEKENQ